MLIKDTHLTEGLRARLANAGSGRTLDVFPVGTDIYVGAELAGEEQIEVIAISAAHAAEPFGGSPLEVDPPDGYNIMEPNGLYRDEIAAIEEARGLTHDCARYGITKSGGLRIRSGENGDTMPPEAWAWLTDKWRRSGGKRS